MSETTKSVVEATGVSKSYGDLSVLRDVSLSLESGKVYALIGANGSGKTTLLRILAGLLQPDAGEVVRRTEGAERAVGYLPQKPSFRDGFTVGETLRFYTRLLEGVDEGYASDALKSVGLSDARDRRVSDLSGGMTRLLGVAQSRVGEPPVMMVDEPTSGLDPGMTGRIFGVLGGVADDGAAVLLTTHDLGMAERHADEVVMIHDGGVAESGAPDEVAEGRGADGLTEAFDAVIGEGGRS
jgi:ABC-type multidrug transport system ATPase subunit